MKCWWTMLMPRAMASLGPLDVDLGTPSSRIVTLVGPREPVQDVHERGLAGAVLAQQGMDLARSDVAGRCRRWRRHLDSAW